jgi:hypothetical protein
MAGKVAELANMFGNIADEEGRNIGFLWDKWSRQRDGWIEEKKELRSFIFATDTSTTSNSGQWKNNTTMPKLCQIRDNLHSNYVSAIFPNDNWLRWEAYDKAAASKDVRQMVTAYMRHKMIQADLRTEVSNLIYDYIDYGNCFAEPEWDFGSPSIDGNGHPTSSYTGPRVRRISPLDIVFNPLAPTFGEAPKIVRYIKSVGEIARLALVDPMWKDAYDKTMDIRSSMGLYTVDDTHKALGFSVDGFGNMQDYYESEYVEILRFLGDYYEKETGEVHTGKEIIVIDRSITVDVRDITSPVGTGNIAHAGWRKRPDNLYAMGPLDNLVGMQYRIDHLQNLKADAADLCVHPPLAIQGDVEPFTWEPEAVIQIIGEGSVTEIGKGVQGIAVANQEIDMLEMRMEEYAGAPKQAMGIRTPGEKTAHEVQSLDNAAGRIFQEKTVTFEIFLEQVMKGLLAEATLHEGGTTIPMMDEEMGFVDFAEITNNDLIQNGTVRPVGARHFAQTNMIIKNLSETLNGPIGQMIAPHLSAKALATMVEDVFELQRYDLVKPNVAVHEQAETQSMANTANETNMVEMGTSGVPENEPEEEEIPIA